MADNRDVLAQMLAAGQTGGLTPGDFTTFANKLNDPTALQAWNDAGGIFAQNGGQVPDPDEQYFGNKGPQSGSTPETSWMHSVQPWQQGGYGGGETTYQSQQMIQPGFIGAGGAMHADPAYWGYQGRGQGYAPGSVGDISGFNNNRWGGAAGGTGGLTPQDAATFSRLVGPKAFQEWLNAGGVQGQFGGGMGGAVGGGGGGGGVGGGQGPGGGGQGPGGGGQGRGGGNSATLGGGYSMGGIGSDAHFGPQASLQASFDAANAAQHAATASALSNSFAAQSGALGEQVAGDLGALGEGFGGVGYGGSPY